MLADPQSVTYNSVAKSLPAISRGSDSSTYQLNDAGTIYTMAVSHAFKTRNRAVIRLTRTSTVTDPLSSATNISVGMTATMTVDFPSSGLQPSDAQLLANALVGYLTSATVLKIVNGET